MKRGRTALVAVVATVALILIAATGAWRWVWDPIVRIAAGVHERYGVDLPVALALFGVGELLFCGSIAMMLKEAGQQVTWTSIRSFKVRELNLGSSRMAGWLWVNRLSWILPWLVVIAMSFGKVSWVATAAALGEVAATFAIGVLVSLGLKLPWWNDDGGARVKQSRRSGQARIRLATLDDVPALVELEREVWGGALLASFN